MENSSTVNFFSLSGLQDLEAFRGVSASFTIVTYLLIIALNVTLISTVCVEKSLHEPMYIFVCNLCANGLYGTVGFYPKFLLDLFSEIHVISYSACLTQGYIIYSSVVSEITILNVMSFDRYIAICKPLQYHIILTPLTVFRLLCFVWGFSLLTSIVSLILTLRIPLCGSHIGKLFCDNPSILKLGCISTTPNQVWSFTIILIQVAQVFLIVFSYIRIVRICIESSEGRTKFMHTCVPHLLTLIIFITTTLFDVAYGWQATQNLPLNVRNAMALQFLVLPPLLNPLVYGLQLQQIRRKVLRKCCRKDRS
ncbi:olfactory receptor 6N1-like [Chanos chanos]|uniref:Olfactory receptor n=1 Tax=Chanos chanos TaxID=29144 RepID=A0A6J2VLC3_CHACN|nr:olfactory receptor 6N1-like [Chanos chanos]